jgi:AbrB family looped-hinge helix DNA binding protein
MNQLSTTKLSSKGQIVIPEEIRKSMGFHTGDQFLVLAEKGVLILKTIERPCLDEYESLITKSRLLAKSVGMKETDISEAIKAARKSS